VDGRYLSFNQSHAISALHVKTKRRFEAYSKLSNSSTSQART
jgi:hypothetical protein